MGVKPLTAWEASDGSSSVLVDVAYARTTVASELRLTEAGEARITELATFSLRERTAWSES